MQEAVLLKIFIIDKEKVEKKNECNESKTRTELRR